MLQCIRKYIKRLLGIPGYILKRVKKNKFNLCMYDGIIVIIVIIVVFRPELG